MAQKLQILFRRYAKAPYIVGGITSAFLLITLLGPSRSIFWEKEFVIDTQEDIASLGYSGQRKIAQDREGNFYIAYRKKVSGYYQIFISKIAESGEDRITSGNASPITLVAGKNHQRVPSIAVDSEEILHSVWYGSDALDANDNRQVKYSTSLDKGLTWSQWVNIANVPGYSGEGLWQEHPNILVGKDDVLYVVWEGKDLDHKNQQIKLVKSLDGGKSWNNWTNIKSVPTRSQSRPTILQDGTGRLHVIMYAALGGNEIQQIYYSYSDDDGVTWSNWTNISNSPFDARHISSALDQRDVIHVVWRSPASTDGATQIHYTSLHERKWAEPIIISSSDKFQFFPSLAVDTEGTPYIVWMESPEDYGFPREAPKKGKVYFSYAIGAGQFSEGREVSIGDDNLYPTLPSIVNIGGEGKIPVVYVKGKKLYKIVLNDLQKYKK